MGENIVKTGFCKFCGQMQALELSRELAEEECDEMATYKCTCEKAKLERRKKEAEEKAIGNIEKLFGKSDAAAVLKAAVHQVAVYAINSVSVNMGNGVTGKLDLDNDDKVRIKKTTTLTDMLTN